MTPAFAVVPPAPLASDQYITPPAIIDRVLDVFGTIDLDPCADDAHSIPAKCHYDQHDNGLMRDWVGKAFINPPYSRPLLGMFIEKFNSEWWDGHLVSAIVLIPARTDTEWFQPLWQAQALCFIKGRLHFSGTSGCGRFASALAYFGPNPWMFEGAFQDLGRVVRL